MTNFYEHHCIRCTFLMKRDWAKYVRGLWDLFPAIFSVCGIIKYLAINQLLPKLNLVDAYHCLKKRASIAMRAFCLMAIPFL